MISRVLSITVIKRKTGLPKRQKHTFGSKSRDIYQKSNIFWGRTALKYPKKRGKMRFFLNMHQNIAIEQFDINLYILESLNPRFEAKKKVKSHIFSDNAPKTAFYHETYGLTSKQ